MSYMLQGGPAAFFPLEPFALLLLHLFPHGLGHGIPLGNDRPQLPLELPGTISLGVAPPAQGGHFLLQATDATREV